MCVEVLCWIDHVWSFNECVCCACVPSVHLIVPFIGFVYVFVCRTLLLMLQFESWITCVCSPYVFCVCLHTMWSGESLQLLCILPFGILCLSAISMRFVQIMLAVCMLVGMVV